MHLLYYIYFFNIISPNNNNRLTLIYLANNKNKLYFFYDCINNKMGSFRTRTPTNQMPQWMLRCCHTRRVTLALLCTRTRPGIPVSNEPNSNLKFSSVRSGYLTENLSESSRKLLICAMKQDHFGCIFKEGHEGSCPVEFGNYLFPVLKGRTMQEVLWQIIF